MNINDSVTMFYNASPQIFEKTKILRKNMTDSELKLWGFIKGKKILGLRFRAQHPTGIYIADFYCHSIKLVIEVDGGIHKSKDQKEYDIGRDDDLNAYGIRVIRFTNEEVKNDIDFVIQEIKRISDDRKLVFQSPLQGIQG